MGLTFCLLSCPRDFLFYPMKFHFLLCCVVLSSLVDLSKTQTLPNYNVNLTSGCIFSSGFCDCLQQGESCYDPQKTDITIMYGKGNWYATESNLGNYSCPSTNCYTYEGNGTNDRSHAMLGSSEPKNYPQQLKLDLTFENSGLGTEIDENLCPFFDVKISFRRLYQKNLWLPMSYINADMDAFKMKGSPFSHRSNNISIFVSNGHPTSKRNEIFSSMSRYFPVNSFGQFTPDGALSLRNEFATVFPQCSDVPSGRSAMWDNMKECMLHHSKITLALENSHAVGYITEKVWQPLKMGAIPIVLGKTFVEPNMPHSSAAIYIDDFPDIETLAKYLHRVVTNETLWYHHVAWKDMHVSKWGSKFKRLVHNSYGNSACLFCEAVRQLLHAEFNFERFIAPQVCINDAFVVEYLRPHALAPQHQERGYDAVYVIQRNPHSHHSQYSAAEIASLSNLTDGHDSETSKKYFHFHYNLHQVSNAVKTALGVEAVVVDQFDIASLEPELLSCFLGTEANVTQLGQLGSTEAPTSQEEVSRALRHLFAYYDLLTSAATEGAAGAGGPAGRAIVIEVDSADSEDSTRVARHVQCYFDWLQRVAPSLHSSIDILVLPSCKAAARTDEEAISSSGSGSGSEGGSDTTGTIAAGNTTMYLVSRVGAMRVFKALPLKYSLEQLWAAAGVNMTA